MASEETKDIRLTLSKELWAKFDGYKARHGFQTRTEAMRAIVIQVVGFGGNGNGSNGTEPQSAGAV